jgi:hypothetical protein
MAIAGAERKNFIDLYNLKFSGAKSSPCCVEKSSKPL